MDRMRSTFSCQVHSAVTVMLLQKRRTAFSLKCVRRRASTASAAQLASAAHRLPRCSRSVHLAIRTRFTTASSTRDFHATNAGAIM